MIAIRVYLLESRFVVDCSADLDKGINNVQLTQFLCYSCKLGSELFEWFVNTNTTCSVLSKFASICDLNLIVHKISGVLHFEF